MPRRACCRVDDLEIQQSGVKEGADRVQMAHRSNPADGKTRLRADQSGVRLAQWLARGGAGLGGVHLIAAGGDEKDCPTALSARKDHRFCDLVQGASGSVGRLLCGACLWPQFERRDLLTRICQCLHDALEAFAHPETLSVAPAIFR